MIKKKSVGTNIYRDLCDLIVNAGSQNSGVQGKGTNTFFVERSSLSSIPYVFDDPPKTTSRNNSSDVNDIIVDFYNAFITGNMKCDYKKPISSVMLVTIFSIKPEPRCIILYETECIVEL